MNTRLMPFLSDLSFDPTMRGSKRPEDRKCDGGKDNVIEKCDGASSSFAFLEVITKDPIH